MYNQNAGFGQSLMAALPMRVAGKVFVVGDSSTVNVDRIKQLFGVDPDGTLRYFETINEAVNNCTADAGDIVLVAPGHTETVDSAGASKIDVNGVKIIGLGQGDLRPTIDFTSATGADLDVSGNDVVLENLLFTGNIDALTGPVDVDGDDVLIKDCEYRDVTGQATDVFIVTGNRVTIDGLYFAGASGAGAESAVQINGTDRFTLKNFHIDGNFNTGAVESVTAQNTNLKITEGYIRTRNSTDKAVVTQSTDTGDVGPNLYIRLADDAANITECIEDADLSIWDPIYVCNADGERGMQYNGTASTDA